MALAAHPGAQHHWGRWPQQMAQEYAMMDHHQELMSYGSRPQGLSIVTGQMMAPHYMVNLYSSGPINTIPAPQYHGANSYGPYGSPGHIATHTTLPFKPEYHGTPDAGHTPTVMVREDDKPPMLVNGQLSPPLSRRGSEVKMEKEVELLEPAPIFKAKTITANQTLDPKDRVDFDTNVDQLMKAIQFDEPASADSDFQPFTPMASPQMDMISAGSSPASSAMSPCSSSQGSAMPKKYFCDGPGCNKGFSQKTHLVIHKRTHTGNRPYVCRHPGCNLTFSQLGNLKTHERRHTGERPYKCSKCDKTFAQKGNVKSHEETHEGKKPYRCLLDNCDKRFSQLGNMKTHQNNFHKDALQDLTAKFAKFSALGYIPDEYRNLFEYFKLHYKNSNKGIKGRGKARKISRKETRDAPRKVSASKPAAAAHREQQVPQESMYTMAAGQSSMADNVPRPGSFSPVFPGDNMGCQNANAGHMLYEEGHARQMGFGALY